MKAKNRPMQGKWHEMNRKQRRQMIRKMQSEDLTLEMVHPDAAGVDIGNESHYVAVPPIRDLQPVRRFGCTTAELKTMADWLKQCGIQTVAMQSKMAASTLRISNTYLGAQFRRLRTRLGAPIAIKAMAAKLARLVYRMLRYGIRFVDHGAEFYEAQHRRQQIHYLK
jgi:hypothetical protein